MKVYHFAILFNIREKRIFATGPTKSTHVRIFAPKIFSPATQKRVAVHWYAKNASRSA
jgi:hypothetical protein